MVGTWHEKQNDSLEDCQGVLGTSKDDPHWSILYIGEYNIIDENINEK